MKPFLLLAVRADDAAADNEYESFVACAGLHERDLRRYRLEQRPLSNIDLQDWSGIFLGGGPFNASDPEGSKSLVQRRVDTTHWKRRLPTVAMVSPTAIGESYLRPVDY